MPLDLDATIALLSRTAEELGGHVRGALDMRRGFSERQASALERIAAMVESRLS